nr:MAG TPA: hypothetical protein [Caudoviricetes sp.]
MGKLVPHEDRLTIEGEFLSLKDCFDRSFSERSTHGKACTT